MFWVLDFPMCTASERRFISHDDELIQNRVLIGGMLLTIT